VLHSCSRCKCKEIDGNLLLNTLVIYTRYVWIARYCSTKWELYRTQTIVLVGHGLGGLVVKSLTIEVDRLSKSERSFENSEEARCKAFKPNIKGIVFYSVPHTTSKDEFVNYCKSYATIIQCLDAVEDFKHFNQHMVLLNVGFEKSIQQQYIKLFAFVEGQKVQSHGYLSSFVGFSSLGQNLVS
jgi:hypothetical protein